MIKIIGSKCRTGILFVYINYHIVYHHLINMILQASLRTRTSSVCIRDRDIAMQLTQTALGLSNFGRRLPESVHHLP